MTTVGTYLTQRLEQIGIRHVFGVPGDYVLGYFDVLVESNINLICTCNELNAGYAADAYARVNGVGAACVTYGVGSFSLFNAVAGANAERVPMIVISGSPDVAERKQHHLLHHALGDLGLQKQIFEKITVASTVITSPDSAPGQIDEAITTCLQAKRPIYLEIPRDIVNMPCREPSSPLQTELEIETHKEALEEALRETTEMVRKAKKTVILAGVEVHRLGIQKELQALIDHTGFLFATTMLGKTVVPEKHPAFIGVYGGALGSLNARDIIESADLVINLGTLMTDMFKGFGTYHLNPVKMVIANSDRVAIKYHLFNKISLLDFIRGLIDALPQGSPVVTNEFHPSAMLREEFIPSPDKKITLDRFYKRVDHIIHKNNLILASTGDSILSVSQLYLPENVDFIGQAYYLSIGYSLPATLGAGLAAPARRPILFIGDGAFQMTAQELSTILRENIAPIIFLMNNDGYTIERFIHDGPYNDLQLWNYHQLPEVFCKKNGWGMQVKTEGDLEKALKKALDTPEKLAMIEIVLNKMDCSESLKNLGKAFNPKQNQK